MSPLRLVLTPTVVLRAEPQYYDTYVAFDHRGVGTDFLTEEEFRALEFIRDGPAEPAEVSESLGIGAAKCRDIIERMLKKGLVRAVEHEVVPAAPPRVRVDPGWFDGFEVPFLSAPVSVDVFVTNRCNLSCVHCFSSRGDEAVHDLPLGTLKEIFSQLERMGVFEVRINGGEPLMHPDISQIISTLGARRFRKVIITNGTLLNEELVHLLKETGTIPTVSLDDSVEEEHDRFRGVGGSFRRTIDAMDLLRRMGVHYGVNCCLHRGNLRRFRDVIRLSADLGASRIAFLDLKFQGRMRDNTGWAPPYQEYEKLRKKIQAAKLMFRGIDISLDAFMGCKPMRESVREARRGYVTCQAGKTNLSIGHDGSVYPCNTVISDPRWCMGNILEEDLVDIWFSKRWIPFRGGIRTEDLWACRKCADNRRCGQLHCRLIPYAAGGDLYGPHPMCARSKKKL